MLYWYCDTAQLDLSHWLPVLSKIDGILNTNVINISLYTDLLEKPLNDESISIIKACLTFLSKLLRSCQRKRYFLSLEVTDNFIILTMFNLFIVLYF